MTLRFGIDAGSKTLKIVILNEDGAIMHSIYQRHRMDIKATMHEALHGLIWRYGNLEGTVGITGSAGIGLSEALGLPFIQEVIATKIAAEELHPDAKTIIELGGEDAKVIFLGDNPEQRMNATCAGGTGGFIDNIAFMLGKSSRHMSSLSISAMRIYPIASRCAVFAQTDVRPLLNAGVRKEDIAGSALEAVVRQTIGGLACGRTIEAPVIFLGGPLEHIPDLVRRFHMALGLNSSTGIKPDNAHLYTARGAAIYGAAQANAPTMTLEELQDLVDSASFEADIPTLPPLFTSEEQIEAFRERHDQVQYPRLRIFDAEGPLYVGIDAGSTAVKLAAIDEQGRLLCSFYHAVEGDALATAADEIERFYSLIRFGERSALPCCIAHATATGYGEDLLKAVLGVDSGIVETTAHTTAARAIEPDASFILDIGGQDMKAIWLEDGIITDAVLNEACSSGCGAFVEGMAHSLRSNVTRFSENALLAEHPTDLGTKCTVFMTSRVRHAQKSGVPVKDLSAGIAYSVVRNALFRIIGMDNTASMGDKIIVQGGTFKSEAILRAFEKVADMEVIRPDVADLMGAIGAALIARERAHERQKENSGVIPHSTLIPRDQIKKLNPQRRSLRCKGCSNACMLSVIHFGENQTYITGNRCEHGLEIMGDTAHQRIREKKPPNAIALKAGLIGAYHNVEGTGERGAIRIGIVDTLNAYPQVPFWHRFFSELGFSVLVPHDAQSRTAKNLHEGIETIPSESVCYPAKVAHTRLYKLYEQGATAAFMPEYERGRRCAVATGYVNALADSVPLFSQGKMALARPHLHTLSAAKIRELDEDRASLFAAVRALAGEGAPAISDEELEAALDAAAQEQERFEALLDAGNRAAYDWAHEEGHHGIVFAGRPYHADPEIIHNVCDVLLDLGFSIIDGHAPLLKELAPAPDKNYAWGAGAPLRRLAEICTRDESLDIVITQSFGCEYDAVSIPQATAILKAHRKPCTALKIDDITDTAHIRIRLRTLAESIEERTRAQKRAQDGQPSARRGKPIPPVSNEILDRARKQDLGAFSGFERLDLETARVFNRDLCLVVAAIVGRAIRIVGTDPDIAEISVPHVCESCLLDALPDIIRDACGRVPSIRWVDDFQEAIPTRAETVRETDEVDPVTLVGIVGAPSLCFDPSLNDDIASFVASQGFRVMIPEKERLFTDDVRYLEQLDAYARKGVTRVIYLQSFGCLKGHVRSRGALHELRQRYPGMTITVLDYDAEASALNRENRIRLALSS